MPRVTAAALEDRSPIERKCAVEDDRDLANDLVDDHDRSMHCTFGARYTCSCELEYGDVCQEEWRLSSIICQILA